MLPKVLLLGLLLTGLLTAQNIGFVPVTGANAPSGAAQLFQDRQGRLWLGGFEYFQGLRYFDGTRFVVPVTESFRDVAVSEIAEDGDGGIWIAATDKGLYRVFRGRLEKVIDGLGSPSITFIAPDVMLATLTPRAKTPQHPVMMRLTKRGGSWIAETLGTSMPIIQPKPDGAGNVLFPCEEGYCEVRAAEVVNWRVGSNLPVTRHRIKTPSPAIVAFRDHFGCVWLRSFSEAAYQCPADDKPVTLPFSVAGNGGSALSQLSDGSIVIPSYGRLAIGRPGKFRVATMANGYPSYGSLLVGRDDSIWLSCANGLFVLPSYSRLEYWGQQDGLDGNTWSILPIDGKVFAISGDNICLLSPDRKRWQNVKEFGCATHLMAGPGHTILVSSCTNGVAQLAEDGKTLRQSLPANVSMLAPGPDGQIWSTGSNISLVIAGGNRLLLKTVQTLPPAAGGRDVKVAKDGVVWNCSADGLLFGGAHGWRHLTQANGLPNNNCLSLAGDADGNLWYGSTGRLYAISARPGLRPLMPTFRLGEEVVPYASYFLGLDRQGRIWQGTSHGVYVADPKKGERGEWLYLNQSDGLPGVDTNKRSFFSDMDGSVWFGIDSSVVHLTPSSDFVNPAYAPSVFVSGFSSDGGQFVSADSINNIHYPAELTAHIGSLQMDRRNALRFRYRLLPAQTAWTAARKVDIPMGRLSWGAHTFEVQASLGSGPWSQSARKSFEILKPIWLSTPVLLCFAVAGAVTAGRFYRSREHRRRLAKFQLPGLDHWRSSVLALDDQNLEGVVLDRRFEIKSVIAHGGFATVWMARDRRHRRRACALKVFRSELSDHDWMLKRFRQEVAALERIHHSNVVRIYGHGTVNGAPYLVMEFIEGKTLREVLQRQPLTIVQTAAYLRQVGDALAEIHAHGICHRDLKPENLMLRRDAGPAEIVLIDFSIAIVQDPDETIHGLSRAAGTFYYMAPEQAVGYATASSDIYSLAKLIIEMLTGKRLSTLLPDASIDLPMRVRELLVQMRAGISPASIDLLASALEFDPARRPYLARDFAANIAQDLEAVASSRGAALKSNFS